MTITEALAELKTIEKRLTVKAKFLEANLYRPDALRDPLEAEGGQAKVVAETRQSITDLMRRSVELRKAIRVANESTVVTIGKFSLSIADWLVWRRSVGPQLLAMYNLWRQKLAAGRTEAAQRYQSVVLDGGSVANKPTDIHVAIGERQLAVEIEEIESTLGTLDGALSLVNATTQIAFGDETGE